MTVSRAKIRIIEDTLLTGIKELIDKKDFTKETFMEAVTILITNVSTEIAEVKAEIADCKAASEGGFEALKNTLDKKVSEKVSKAIDVELIQVIDDKVRSTVDAKVDERVSGEGLAGKEGHDITKHIVDAQVKRELDRTKDMVILSCDQDTDFTSASLKEAVLKQLNISRLTLDDCHAGGGKPFAKKDLTIESVKSPKSGANSSKKFWKLVVRGRSSKLGVFRAFRDGGQSTLAKVNCANAVPEFLRVDHRRCEFFGHLIRKRYASLKTRSSVDAKSKGIVLSVATREPNAKFSPLIATRAKGAKFSIEELEGVESEDDPKFIPILEACASLIKT